MDKTKNIYKWLIGAVVVLTSCADLDQTSISSIDKDDFYQSEAEIEAALLGVYEQFTEDGFYGMYNNQSIYINDLQTDYCMAGAQTNSAHIRELSNFAVQPTNYFVEYAWEEHYTAINRANVVIDKVEAASWLDDDARANYTNEARFLRALMYFNLVRYFGGVPIVLHDGDGEGEPRNTVDEVYEQIVSDFEAAEDLPSDWSTTDSKASAYAASAMLAKVYLVWAQTETDYSEANQSSLYQKAVSYADKVIDSGKYELCEKFIDNWSTDKKNGVEHIFSIEHDVTNAANITGHCSFATNWSDSEPVLITTSTKYYDEMDAGDQRRDGSWAKTLYDPTSGEDFTFAVPRFRKYIDSLNYGNTATIGYLAGESVNTTVLRYAEILLIKAEAENELNGPTSDAYAAINEVRKRAYWSPYSNQYNTPADGRPIELTGLSQSEFREALRLERWYEFILEGQRWFDLIRWRTLVTTVRDNTEEDDLKYQNVSVKNYLLPLPQDQIDLNPNLEQNWGYSGETTGSPYDDTYQ